MKIRLTGELSATETGMLGSEGGGWKSDILYAARWPSTLRAPCNGMKDCYKVAIGKYLMTYKSNQVSVKGNRHVNIASWKSGLSTVGYVQEDYATAD